MSTYIDREELFVAIKKKAHRKRAGTAKKRPKKPKKPAKSPPAKGIRPRDGFSYR